eukprot:TRINITY_DN1051_c0_g2_i3.p1 TRINITY_DN1051_c0_g2~~TRINITY_DN1051_c0_g2_i3.p1  ORF type:complete len:646 (-),score=76.85 TRINITY_DN1051_c0_g2_i3:1099-3036(-)
MSLRQNAILSTPGKGVHLYVYIPASNGYSLKRVPDDIPLKDVISRYHFLLPLGDISRYHVFHNGLRLMDEERSLSSYNIQSMATIEIKRDSEYEFTIQEQKDQRLCLACNTKGAAGAKQLAQVLWEGKIRNWGDYEYILIRSPELNAVPLDGEVNLVNNRLMEGEILELQVKSKKTGKIGTKTLSVTYSPFTEREKQRTALMRSGYLKKQGGGAGGYKNWKKRLFVLDKEQIQYFEDEKHLQKPLGTVYLDEIISVHQDTEKSTEKAFYFVISVTGRDLLASCKTAEDCDGWLRCINGMMLLAKTEAVFVSENDREEKQKVRENSRMKGSTQQRGISGVFNVQHLTHISTDWKWSGDVNVFTMLEVLGKGASGKVLRAQVRDVKFDIAIKICKNMNPKVQAELEKEIDVLKQCKHPNIVAYYGTKILSETQEIWIIMDYCGVGSVKDVMKITDEVLSESQIAYVLQQTLKGLCHLHQRGILHLDIKAANILLTDDGEVKLADFGVSEALKTGFVVATDYVGSPLFMSPEVIRKDKYNDRTDIWSLGITTIEMAQGRPPNTDINRIEDLPKLLERPTPTLNKPQHFSVVMNEFIAHCLVTDPTHRPNAIELMTDPFLAPGKVPDKTILKDLIHISNQLAGHKREKL